jgi:hydroxypyruvate isomerase
MRRREFVGVCAGAAAASAAFGSSALAFSSMSATEADGVPFLLSVMLWTVYRDLPFLQRLEKIHEAGYRAVELVEEFKNWQKQDFAEARRKKQELGIEFDGTTGVWQPLADPSARELFLKSLHEFIPIMRELECSRLIMQTGDKVPGLSQEQMHANCIETLKRGGDIAAKNAIELLIENIDPEENPKYFLTSSAEGFEIVRAVGNPHVKFLYDFFHEQIAEGNLIAKLEKNLDLLGLVHVADVPGRHQPGTGEINYSNIFRKLAQLGYSRYVAMEFIPLGDPVKELREARELAISSARSVSKNVARSFESSFESSFETSPESSRENLFVSRRPHAPA